MYIYTHRNTEYLYVYIYTQIHVFYIYTVDYIYIHISNCALCIYIICYHGDICNTDNDLYNRNIQILNIIYIVRIMKDIY